MAKNRAPRYIVGIDLGTTHTVVAYADTRTRTQSREIQLFAVEQLVALGEVAERPLLPSVRYHPAGGELAAIDVSLPGHETSSIPDLPAGVVGVLAAELGAKVPGRLVSSAKSWLSHAGVDRFAPILPWGAGDDVEKISPVQASASYLEYIRLCWDQRFADYPLCEQDVVLTLPASFDEAARTLTLTAAELSGLERVRLLEEPQAACYDWIYRNSDRLVTQLADVQLILVCDIGGGTSDLTLIQVGHDTHSPAFSRVSVGDHLMLGGDNMDLALARWVERRLGGEPLSTSRLAQLLQQCRSAKERLLSGQGPEHTSVTLLGAGTKLIAGAQSVSLSRADVVGLVLDGFFPLIDQTEMPRQRRGAIVEFGLPYAADPAISKHLAAFLDRYRKTSDTGVDFPDAVLLNGGVFNSRVFAERLVSLLSGWTGQPPKVLHNVQPDIAVARGAVAFGLARRGKGHRIKSGSARSYFMLIDSSNDSEGRQGICILPKGCEEGREYRLTQQRLSLRTGQPVRFHLSAANDARRYRPGEVVAMVADEFTELPPIATVLDDDSGQSDGEIPVQLLSRYTELGTLALSCVAAGDPSQQWQLEFQLRGSDSGRLLETAERLPAQFPSARELIRQFYGSRSKAVNVKAIKTLRSDLEKLLGRRDSWDTVLLREMSLVLLDGMKRRRRSVDHERVWFNLTGFCLRPGFGYPLDDWRVQQLWPIYEQGIQFVKETQLWAEWWTLWRRVAGGLNAEQQQILMTDLAPHLKPPQRREKGPRKYGYEDMVKLLGSLEHLPAGTKVEAGQWLLERLDKKLDSAQTWWAIGRLGSRIPFYGSAHNLIALAETLSWLDRILAVDWKKTPAAAFAATMLARKSGDRERDLPAEKSQQVIVRLRQIKAAESWVQMVTEVSELGQADQQKILGEALPAGIRLMAGAGE